MTSWAGWLSSLATIATPQASCSYRGSYRPSACGGLSIVITKFLRLGVPWRPEPREADRES